MSVHSCCCVLAMLALTGFGQAQDQGAPPSAPQPPPAAAPDAQPPTPAPDASRVEAILDALQKAGEDLRDIRCRVIYDENDQVDLTRRRRFGQILFLKVDPNPMFFITFDRLEVDGRAAREQKKVWYLFDGRILCEARQEDKHVVEHEVAGPDDKVDFFDLDKTPFPLPFGHRKDYILQRFDVALVAAAPGDPPDTDHLVCTPKPGTRMADKFRKLEFHVRRDVALPSRIKAVSADGYKETVADFPDLARPSVNPGLKPEDFAEPAEWKKQNYDRTREPLKPEPKHP